MYNISIHPITDSLQVDFNSTNSVSPESTDTDSYCFNLSAPTPHDQELEDLRLQLIFWVEGKSHRTAIGILFNMKLIWQLPQTNKFMHTECE